MTHGVLSDYVMLRSFKEMYEEIDFGVSKSVMPDQGRLVTHIVNEFLLNIIPNWKWADHLGRYVDSPCY